MSLEDKKILVAGAGKSGIGSVNLLLKTGATVALTDGKTDLDQDALFEKIDQGKKIPLILGEVKEEEADAFDLLVLSPGISVNAPIADLFAKKGKPVWSEIELAYQAGKGKIAAITGTNGKTTTTALTGEILKGCYTDTFVVGNIGTPYTSVALETTDESRIVAEISSFQLETIVDFCPDVCAVLNITPDHLNRHHTMEAYVAAKERIAENQTKEDVCVLNYEDKLLREFGERTKAEVLYFSSKRKLKRGVYLDSGEIIIDLGEKISLCSVDSLHILGTHNYENVMAAAAMAYAFGVPAEVIQKTVCQFRGVEHRIEFVAEKNGVAFYNDSKGTNPDAAIRGIQAMNRPTVLIGGGYDKDSTYEEWINAFDGKVKKLVLLGATRDKIAETARRLGFEDIVMADSFEEAFDKCVEYSRPGDAVLLSPACASWGMFKNYEERGDKFKELVNQL